MGKFILTVSYEDLVAQVTNLVNRGGQLKYYLTQESVKYSPVKYLIELHKDRVIGTIGLHQHNSKVTELKHLCVHQDYRRQGLGKKLLEKGVKAAHTEFVYGAVRSDNFTNIRNNIRIGMVPIGKKTKGRYSIIVFVRRTNSDTIHRKRNQGN